MSEDHRPVVPRFMQSSMKPTEQTPVDETTTTRSVRPFLVAGGRTSADPSLRVETQLLAVAGAWKKYDHEPAALLQLAASPISIAEVSAHLGLPLGTIRVIAADLVASKALTVRQPQATTSPSTIRELIDAVSTL